MTGRPARLFAFGLVLLVGLAGCDIGFREEDLVYEPELWRLTGVEVRGIDRRPNGRLVLADSISREFRLSAGGRARLESFGFCNRYQCYPDRELVNPAVRIEIWLDTAVILDGRELAAREDIAAALGLSEASFLTYQLWQIGASPRSTLLLDPKRFEIPDGRRTIHVLWATEGDAETFTDSTIVEWRRFGF